ncbi:MAG: hypothetical protein ACRC62_15370 [Microcoleus sp.]
MMEQSPSKLTIKTGYGAIALSSILSAERGDYIDLPDVAKRTYPWWAVGASFGFLAFGGAFGWVGVVGIASLGVHIFVGGDRPFDKLSAQTQLEVSIRASRLENSATRPTLERLMANDRQRYPEAVAHVWKEIYTNAYEDFGDPDDDSDNQWLIDDGEHKRIPVCVYYQAWMRKIIEDKKLPESIDTPPAPATPPKGVPMRSPLPSQPTTPPGNPPIGINTQLNAIAVPSVAVPTALTVDTAPKTDVVLTAEFREWLGKCSRLLLEVSPEGKRFSIAKAQQLWELTKQGDRTEFDRGFNLMRTGLPKSKLDGDWFYIAYSHTAPTTPVTEEHKGTEETVKVPKPSPMDEVRSRLLQNLEGRQMPIQAILAKAPEALKPSVDKAIKDLVKEGKLVQVQVRKDGKMVATVTVRRAD